MRSRFALLFVLPLFAGCAELNDALVRFRLSDRDLGSRANSQINEGLERRKSAPPPALPYQPAPAFLDEG